MAAGESVPFSVEWFRTRISQHVAKALGQTVDSIDVHARFRDYGLHSLLATKVIAALSAELKRSVAITAAWEYPTVSLLAEFLAGNAVSGLPVATLCRERESRPDGGVQREPIAVIGIGCRFPSAGDARAFWRLLDAGLDAITEMPPDRWAIEQFFDPDIRAAGKMNTRWGGFLDGVDLFDAPFFSISPREAIEMDPQQRLTLEVAWHALEDAGIVPHSLRESPTGVFMGVIQSDYSILKHRAGAGAIEQHTVTGAHYSIVANRVSYALGLMGPSLAVDTACSSSLVAVHLACQSLRNGESSIALAGGANLVLAPESTVMMTKFGAMSPDGRSKAFDARADGYVRGEGVGIVVLKPLSQAIADGNRIYCVIAGSAINNDGFSNGLTAPNPNAQSAVARAACRDAAFDPGSVQYVEAHGTGTMLGDPIEARALSDAYCANRSTPLHIGSVKTNIGHLEAAAGIAGLIKTALAIHHRVLPRSLHFERPNPHIDFEGLLLRVQNATGAWPQPEAPLVAGVSSFGFGGTNAHIILSENPAAGTRSTLNRFSNQPPVDAEPLPRVAFVFSGQGGQWAGMARSMLQSAPAFRAAVARCDEIFRDLAGWSLLRRLAEEPRRHHHYEAAEFVQPMIFAYQIGTAAVWKDWGLCPDVVIGHSMGEVAAAYVAGILSLEDAVRIIRARSQALGHIAGRGAMALVTADAEALKQRLAELGGKVSLAAINGPQSTVLSGDIDDVARVVYALSESGIECHPVRADMAAHSEQVDELEQEMMASLGGISPMRGLTPFLSTMTAQEECVLDARYWFRQLREPVSFAATVECALRSGINRFVEIGPHPILMRDMEATIAARSSSAKVCTSGHRDEDGIDVMSRSAALLPMTRKAASSGPFPLFLSGNTVDALEAGARALAAALEEDTISARDLAFTLATSRANHTYRFSAAVRDEADTSAMLHEVANGLRRKQIRKLDPRGTPDLVFAFSESGIAWKEIGLELWTEPVFRQALDRCDAALRPFMGWSVVDEMLAKGRSAALPHDSRVPIFAFEVAFAELLRSLGILPAAAIGDGAGAVAAAYIMGRLSLDKAAQAVALALALNEAVPVIDVPETSAQNRTMTVLAIGPNPHFTRSSDMTVVTCLQQGSAGRESLMETVCALFALGYDMKTSAMFAEGSRQVSLPLYPFQRNRYWLSESGMPQAAPVEVTVAPPSRNITATYSASEIAGAESPREALRGFVRARIAEIIKGTLDVVPVDQPFKALGVDSMMGVEIVMNLEEEFGLTLPETLMWDYPTVAALSTFLADTLHLPSGATPKEDAHRLSDDEALDEVLTSLETMSTDESRKVGSDR